MKIEVFWITISQTLVSNGTINNDIDSDNVWAPNRLRTIIWTNFHFVYWPYYASFGIDRLNQITGILSAGYWVITLYSESSLYKATNALCGLSRHVMILNNREENTYDYVRTDTEEYWNVCVLVRLPLSHLPPAHTTAAILPNDTFTCIFMNENDRIPIRISLKFVPRSPTDDKPVLV